MLPVEKGLSHISATAPSIYNDKKFAARLLIFDSLYSGRYCELRSDCRKC
ncbi:hypothetical protein GCWU000342_00682 [Shuttleworthella satelles DSM 14600]|uniref:Uncharacterized protein n=1 Tax=Shuttleworthella satelles DSM 14600 TaxID=626523 RepID=C4G9M9_9FIRM|nr:hypothetical protein GCWU000342_00682 [Shuttleworthia satelles DSM 14600]